MKDVTIPTGYDDDSEGAADALLGTLCPDGRALAEAIIRDARERSKYLHEAIERLLAEFNSFSAASQAADRFGDALDEAIEPNEAGGGEARDGRGSPYSQEHRGAAWDRVWEKLLADESAPADGDGEPDKGGRE